MNKEKLYRDAFLKSRKQYRELKIRLNILQNKIDETKVFIYKNNTGAMPIDEMYEYYE